MRSPPVGLDFGDFRNKLKITLQALLINYILIGLMAIVIWIISSESELIKLITTYRNDASMKLLFIPISNPGLDANGNPISISLIMKWFLLSIPAAEEVIWRGPIYVLLNIKIKEYHLTKYFIVVASLSLNYFWASSHVFTLPIFLAGLPLYWLLAKTRSLWTTMLYHCLANATIYTIIQVALYLKII